MHAALARHAEAGRRHAPQDPRLSGDPGRMVLNGAYLVGASSGTAFAAAVTELAERHPALRMELTGPWPPYSFVHVEAVP